jgi:hypothetical protein
VRFQRKKLVEIQPPCKQRGRHEGYLHRNNPKENEKTLDQTSRAIGTQLMLQVLRKRSGRGGGCGHRQKAPTNCFSLKDRKHNTAFAAASIPCNKWRWIKSQALDGCRSQGRGLSFPVLAGGIGSSKV